MNLFWKKVMPASVLGYEWGKDFGPKTSVEDWEKNIVPKVRAMDEDEFDLFLASVVMNSAKEQLMGLELTKKIEFFRSLRK